MSDCIICGQPPCICRCALDAPERWYGVLCVLAAAQLHAKRINALRAASGPSCARYTSSGALFLALRSMRPSHATP